MRRTLHTSGTADAAAVTLCGGRAPRYWRRECERVAARGVALERVARWGAEMSTPSPGLSETPLWGELLDELTARAPARETGEDARSSRAAGTRNFDRTITDARTPRAPDNIHPPARHARVPRGFPKPPPTPPSQVPATRAAKASGESRHLPGAHASPLTDPHGLNADAQTSHARLHSAGRAARDGLVSSENLSTAESGAAFVPEVESLPREVGRELLHRLTGRNASSPDAAQERERTPRRTTSAQHHARTHAQPVGTRFSPPSPRVAALPDALQQPAGRMSLPDPGGRQRVQEWRGLLATRAALALRRAVATADAHTQDAGSLIAHQWSSPLVGESAPRALLMRFADVHERASLRRRPSSPRTERDASHSQPPNTTHETATQARTEPVRSLSRTRREASDAPVHFRGIEFESEHSREVRPALVSPGESAAPAPAESLPPLLPPPFVGIPVLPIALETAREGTRLEAQEAGEDLDALAAKIKLILDEQARRHGIDV